ncbi:cupin domain-containing protein [Roseateles sp. LYH14W]|uniref:Cupin domain-containing protein n=1 Tax=Pelomonas parva TaxID=3299032 RepID=A0ABW7F642_9BURK
MALMHAAAGAVVYAGPLGERIAEEKTTTLVKVPGLHVFRLVLRAGEHLEEHRVPQALVIQCLEGEMAFEVHGKALRMTAGDLCHIPPNELHAVTATTAASALVMLHGERPHASAIDTEESSS